MKLRSSKWDSLHTKAKNALRIATGSLGLNDLPVALLPISEAWHTQVIFQPLLTEGGLAVTNGGFKVYLRSSAAEAPDYQRSFANGGGNLPTRTRFTVAHELAHTLFFDWKGPEKKPQCLVDGQRGPELESLERECNDLAGELLVPDHLLKAVLSKSPKIENPQHILNIANRFAVSPECLVIQLRRALSEDYSRNAALVISQEDGQVRVLASALGVSVSRIMGISNQQLSAEAASGISSLCSGERKIGNFILKVSLGGRAANQEVRAVVDPLSSHRNLAWFEIVGEPRLTSP